MFKSLLLFSAATLLAFAPSASISATPQETAPAAPAAGAKNPVKPTPEGLAKAKATYQIDCAMCHGDNGNGKTDLAQSMGLTIEDWTNPSTLANKEDQALFNQIRNGKDKMPPEDAARVKDNEVWNLVSYIRSFSKGQPAAAAVK